MSEPGQLLDAIRTVARGGSVIDPLVVERLVRATTKSPSSPLSTLSKRELEVLGEVAQGKSNEAVARSLFLSERAVEKHINALFAKLGLAVAPEVNRRVTAVLLWLSERDARYPADREASTLCLRRMPPDNERMSDASAQPAEHPRAQADGIAVLIVDDQAPFRAVARTLVSMIPGWQVVAEAATGEEAVEAAQSACATRDSDGHQPARYQRHRGDPSRSFRRIPR